MTDPEGGWRSDLVMAGAAAGCLILAVGVWVVIIGVPVSIYIGVTTGDWSWFVGVTIFGAVLWVGNKVGLLRSLND